MWRGGRRGWGGLCLWEAAAAAGAEEREGEGGREEREGRGGRRVREGEGERREIERREKDRGQGKVDKEIMRREET